MRFDSDDLGNRMKLYEGIEANRVLIPQLPTMVRLDGKAFHTFTKGLKRPYDERFANLMSETTKFLVDKTNARIGYCQSDEISLVLYLNDINSEPIFGGRICKLTSVISSMCTAFFNSRLKEYISEKSDALAYFDCRVWNVPSLTEAANTLVWRELDATKNAISMAAQSVFSHKQLQGKSGAEMQEMLHQKGINFNDYPAFFKRGTYVRRITKKVPFSKEELKKLPTKHKAHTTPGLMVERSVVERIKLEPILKIQNRVEVLFGEKKDKYAMPCPSYKLHDDYCTVFSDLTVCGNAPCMMERHKPKVSKEKK